MSEEKYIYSGPGCCDLRIRPLPFPNWPKLAPRLTSTILANIDALGSPPLYAFKSHSEIVASGTGAGQ